MKLLIYAIALFGGLLLSSCSNEFDESVYSCNKTVNHWVVENLPQIKKMTRSEWKQLPIEVSSATYVAFTPEQKFAFWKEKFQEIKTLPWQKEEIEHIEKAEDFFYNNPCLWATEEMTDEDLDRVDLFCYKWSKYAEEHLKWNKIIIYSILGTGYTPTDTQGTIVLKTTKSIKSVPLPGGNLEIGNGGETELWDCNCNINSAISCALAGPPCEKASCNYNGRSCGWFWSQPCNGRCGGL